MRSGYVEESSKKSNRPPFGAGFFVEDFTYVKVKDEDVLDENNGRFCVTPDFPNGTYAYFTTINTTTAELSGPFERYRKPVFPYVIGDQYTGLPNKFNFDRKSNQDDFSFEGTPWCRNTEPYNLIEDASVYNYFNIPNNLTQTADVISVAPGTIDNIGISSGGDLYRIGDELDFNNAGTREIT